MEGLTREEKILAVFQQYAEMTWDDLTIILEGNAAERTEAAARALERAKGAFNFLASAKKGGPQ